MESGNSGSMQSSSGGSEEYDSRAAADSISAFLNNTTSIQNQRQPQQPPPQHQNHSSPSVFDSLYFDPLSRSPQISTNPNSLLNLDMVWSKSLRSETDLGGFMAVAPPTQQLLTNQPGQNRGGGGGGVFSSVHIPHGVPEKGTVSGSVSGAGDQITNSNQNMVRNPKKRSRASRRAPTTVLTTDTTNFRAMVQEFTGIPAPPFTSSPFPRSRLDLFGTASSLRSTAHLDPSPPSYLLRPFAQKIQPPPFVSSSSSTSSMVDAIAATTSANNNGTSSSTSINYQIPSELALLKQPQNLLPNPVLNFQSLLQHPPKYPLSSSAILGTKLQGSLDLPSNDSPLKIGLLEELGLSHGHSGTTLGGLQNMVSSVDGALPRSDNSNNHPSWGDGGPGSHENHHEQGLLKSINGNGKLSFSGPSSDFHGNKGPENVAARSEGMVESWICSSD
ncbi:hypothetical protein SLE2022_297750 [Rubroshorea leprosula]